MSGFDAAEEVKKLKIETKARRKTRFDKSRLDAYKGELVAMYEKGASIAELQRWLRKKRVKVWWSTVNRWLIKNGYKTEVEKD